MIDIKNPSSWDKNTSKIFFECAEQVLTEYGLDVTFENMASMTDVQEQKTKALIEDRLKVIH